VSRNFESGVLAIQSDFNLLFHLTS
jgi:hypothetical protein